MANLELQIQEFLKINDTDSDYGYGDGDGDGDGYGNGSGSGSGYGEGDDYGYDDGSGYGSGDGSGIICINGFKVNYIDGIPTIISNIKGNIARGFVLRVDLTLEPCYVVKGNNLFAHGSTIKEAVKSLQDKIFENLPVEERINEFTKHFEKDKKYKGSIFFEWHNKLTGSCEMGRKSFVENNGLSLEDEYTVKQFIALTKNSYGGEVIKKLEKYYKEVKE